ncbi:MAG: catalase [Bauldia litoralis]
MAKELKTAALGEQKILRGSGGETHQVAGGDVPTLTTQVGTPVADDQNSLKAGRRGPTLMEDQHFREKIFHFDHERIPERVVHARGFGVHGYFETYDSLADITAADLFQRAGEKTEVFVRFSTVAGNKGSADLARDVRGFAVKFYTQQGNWDLVGNNIPVFFIQDAMKFPDLIHSVKPEPDRGFPQAQSAHNNFWDFVSLTPESMHMLMWVMSDRAIPRSFRMMEGFGVHTFRLINAQGKSTFVKFHWKPKLGTYSLIWDEAVRIMGADPDFHRRDLWHAIESGDSPEWELSVQAFTEKQAEKLGFDVLDPTKLIPEEIVPLTPLGRMVLDRNVDNFFAETEQVAFCPSHLVPGIDFSNDPLLQGRTFSYLDTQLSRLGSPNFHQIPVNRPHVDVANFQRDAHMQMDVPKGGVNYEPNTRDDGSPREDQDRGFRSFAVEEAGPKLRVRPESFADHYTQARLFWDSMTEPEQRNIIGGFGFELGKCDDRQIRRRMLGHLQLVDARLAEGVAAKLGMTDKPERIQPAVQPSKMKPSPALSMYGNGKTSLAGKKIGLLVTHGFPRALQRSLERAAKSEGAMVSPLALHAEPVEDDDGNSLEPDHFLEGAPSALFDAIVVAPGPEGAEALAERPIAVDWIREAFSHLKVIGFTDAAEPLLNRAGIAADQDPAIVRLKGRQVGELIEQAKRHRYWERAKHIDPS